MKTGLNQSEFRRSAHAPGMWLTICVLLVSSTGCTAWQGVRDYIAYNDRQNDFVLGWRNSAWARQAWLMRQDQFAGQPYIDHFGAGFRDGYADVAGGASGCTPALPPRKYWNWRYQTPEGQGKTAAWFAGYPHGAKAAEEDGAGHYSNIQVSSTMLAEYQLGHEPPYNSSLYLHDPEAWCREHGEVIEPGMSPEFAPMEAPMMSDPSLQQPRSVIPLDQGALDPRYPDPQANLQWPSRTDVIPVSLQQSAAESEASYVTRLPRP